MNNRKNYGEVKALYESHPGKKCSLIAFYQRIKRGTPEKDLWTPRSLRIKSKVTQDGRICLKCNEYKSWNHFAHETNGYNQKTSTCKECRNALKTKYRNNPEYRVKENAYKQNRRDNCPEYVKMENAYYNDPTIIRNRNIIGKIDKFQARENKMWYWINKGYTLEELTPIYNLRPAEIKRFQHTMNKIYYRTVYR